MGTQSDPRWQAVVSRDASADGGFVYGVKTTGVYCRPSCPARRAKPAHVTFFATGREATAAGYRPCLRCRPNDGPRGEREAAMVARACRLIEAAESPVRLERLATAVGLSPSHLHRQFKAITGVTPRAYGAAARMRRMRDELGDKQTSITAAIYDAGFASNSRFYETSNEALGMTPTRFRSGGEGAAIRFAVGECSLGSILVAATEKGVCAITLGDDPEQLVRELQDRFPKAEMIGGDQAFEAMVAKVVGFVEAPALGLDLPLDVRGTAFQQRVWDVLRTIPVGQTASYAEIAERIGAPKAVRAVAQACGANRIAVAIPCHRVVRNDGALSGYRWGVARKRALLQKEGVQ
ncbi:MULTISPECIES: bifunctional DNA-binding transcriptional regulator/O6-methylguanine-DNA methyltransferase Ada [unclassified Chelatococcus]|uniref:bifunctional DNA-binding transcriptional regulator/O6-methylguanine-DNA methyltransferase Ada n=1 Tax=unclassified Chelatococcus TaxID=2638111 RepID=UPI001BCB01F1|nr:MULTISPECIES: bifunctional DNA-binding transcriptional regulator/O6-methylguanine-DNA methyltransferase Ada [unclassified Chelatococcus]MBS7697676.1 bifunctional DNA-binding transcriptional regulator/O6-methylguanine-DNA methyltransferase Ada [Chelatococcus sp. YT9]MBX3558467.1 bifunctional DNA-binding transcriptional regulator/O6-methylguanine-DNA methyltransferase Ada [Chelatococcus sp.]